MVEASPHVVMTLITTTKIDGVLQRMGVVFGVLEISLCVHVERKIVVRTIHIPQTFIMLASKTQLLFAYFTVIPI